jgi:hypothetical protein
MTHPSFRFIAIVATAGILLSTLNGCGPSKGLTNLSGAVTWRDKPVPAGTVTIEPDPSRDNRGPQCAAGIAGGRFTSRSNFGSVSGPVIVRVEGYSGKPEGELIIGRQLFPPYEFKADIPKAARHTLDIIVPDEPKPAATSK